MNLNEIIDIESAKERFMNNENLYKNFLFELPKRDLYVQLQDLLQKEDAEAAFEVAHRLKGVIGNLSLNCLGQRIEEVVEILRAGNLPEQSLLTALDIAYQETMKQIALIEQEGISLF